VEIALGFRGMRFLVHVKHFGGIKIACKNFFRKCESNI